MSGSIGYKQNIYIVLFEILFVLIGGFSFFKMDSADHILHKTAEDRFKMSKVADGLRQSSDDLSHFARTYVVTENELYKKQYYQVLDIRNGVAPRPYKYENIYWDLDKDIREEKHPNQHYQSFNEIIAKLPFTKSELSKLILAEKYSNQLVDIEIEAFNVMKGLFKDKNGVYCIQKNANQKLAIKLLHSKEYYSAKYKIMSPIDEFMFDVEKRTEAEIKELTKIVNTFRYIVKLLVLIFILGNIFIFRYLNKKDNEYKDKLHRLNKNLEFKVENRTKKLSDFVISSTDFVWEIDKNGVYSYASEGVENILGYRPEEIVGKTPFDFIEGREKERIVDVFTKILENKTDIKDELNWNISKYGKKVCMLTNGVPYFDKDGIYMGYRGTDKDITERVNLQKNLEQKVLEQTAELNKKNKNLEEAQRIASMGSWEFDVVNDVLSWSDEIYSIFGVEPQQFKATQEAFLSYVHPEDAQKVMESYTKSLDENSVYEMQHRILRKDGSVRYVQEKGYHECDDKGNIVKTSGTVHDITESINYQLKIESANQKFKSVTDAALDAIIMINDKGEVVFWNKMAEKMTGYTENEILGKDLHLAIAPKEHYKHFKKGFSSFIKSGKGAIVGKILELKAQNKNGDLFPIELAVSPLKIEDKWHAVGIIRDISKRKSSERELNNKLQQIIDTQNTIEILTDGDSLNFVNKAFLKFFGYEDLEQFSKKHGCLCDKFVEHESFFHVGKIQDNDKNWIKSIAQLTGRQRVVSMLDSYSIPHAFSVAINKYDEENKIISFTDISDTMIEKLQLKKQAVEDILTGAYNRVYFTQNIDYILKTHNSKKLSTGIIFFDIDFFKNVNDAYGHDVGDYVLKSIVKLVKLNIRLEDKLIRWGGEEFIILTAINTVEDTFKLAEHLRLAIEQYDFKDMDSVTCSFGCSIHEYGSNIMNTIKDADVKLYEAKDSGRNKVVI